MKLHTPDEIKAVVAGYLNGYVYAGDDYDAAYTMTEYLFRFLASQGIELAPTWEALVAHLDGQDAEARNASRE